MRYYKQTENGYIIAIGTGNGGEEITQEEYTKLLNHIKARPTPNEGYDYRLRIDLTWEEYELPPIEDEENYTEQNNL